MWQEAKELMCNIYKQVYHLYSDRNMVDILHLSFILGEDAADCAAMGKYLFIEPKPQIG